MTDPKILKEGFEAVALTLIDFGYSGITVAMVEEVYTAIKKGEDLPHGIIGRFAKVHMEDFPSIFGSLEPDEGTP